MITERRKTTRGLRTRNKTGWRRRRRQVTAGLPGRWHVYGCGGAGVAARPRWQQLQHHGMLKPPGHYLPAGFAAAAGTRGGSSPAEPEQVVPLSPWRDEQDGALAALPPPRGLSRWLLDSLCQCRVRVRTKRSCSGFAAASDFTVIWSSRLEDDAARCM